MVGVVVQGAEGEAPEYIALYELDVAGTYTLQIGAIEGDTTFEQQQQSVHFMLLPSSTADEEGLEEAEAASASGRCCALQEWPGSDYVGPEAITDINYDTTVRTSDCRKNGVSYDTKR